MPAHDNPVYNFCSVQPGIGVEGSHIIDSYVSLYHYTQPRITSRQCNMALVSAPPFTHTHTAATSPALPRLDHGRCQIHRYRQTCISNHSLNGAFSLYPQANTQKHGCMATGFMYFIEPLGHLIWARRGSEDSQDRRGSPPFIFSSIHSVYDSLLLWATHPPTLLLSPEREVILWLVVLCPRCIG